MTHESPSGAGLKLLSGGEVEMMLVGRKHNRGEWEAQVVAVLPDMVVVVAVVGWDIVDYKRSHSDLEMVLTLAQVQHQAGIWLDLPRYWVFSLLGQSHLAVRVVDVRCCH